MNIRVILNRSIKVAMYLLGCLMVWMIEVQERLIFCFNTYVFRFSLIVFEMKYNLLLFL